MSDADSVKVSGPGGFAAEVTGSHQVVYSFVALLIGGFVAACAWWSEAQAATRHAETVAAVRALREAVQRQEETQQALIWVISRPQAEREALNLQKPDVIRRMSR